MTKKKKGSKKSGSNKLFRIIGKALLILVALAILMPIAYRWINPPVTLLMLSRKIKEHAPIEKKWIDIEEISPYLITASVAAEDNNFLGHRGFDWGAIQKAIDERESGKRKRGASTISQQTAKNVFLWPKQSWLRKGCEVYFTFMIETFWSKERIMEVYLNVIEMGNGIYGAEAASQHYFGKSAKDLTRRQACLIAASYPNPRYFNPGKPSSYLSGRANHLVGLSQKIGKIRFDDESVQKAKERYKKREEKRRAKQDNKLLDIHLTDKNNH
ncbi:MAG: monofunctional biosynthetic peptidoglycan transglycosylase [Bacteroidales bacterium]|nr:monofunctional biosynthetic peptidoglycan transglycosylase [Bacteroidales bacterium]